MRALLRERLAAQPQADRARKSAQIISALEGERAVSEASALFLHRSLPTEVSTDSLLAAAILRGQPTYLPRVDGPRLRFVRVDADTKWRRCALGVLEPDSGIEHSPDALRADSLAIVVPGLGFDEAGRRLGRGGGHYDRFLDKARATVGKVHVYAVAFDLQIVLRIPVLEHDQRVDRVVTECRVLIARPTAR